MTRAIDDYPYRLSDEDRQVARDFVSEMSSGGEFSPLDDEYLRRRGVIRYLRDLLEVMYRSGQRYGEDPRTLSLFDAESIAKGGGR